VIKNKKIDKLIRELSCCARDLNKGNPEFYLILRNGIPSALMCPSTFSTVEFSWSLREESIKNRENTVSKGIHEVLRYINDMPAARSLRREIEINFLPVNCFEGLIKEIAETASMISKKREYFDLGKYIGEIKSRRIVNLTEGLSRIEGGDFTERKTPKIATGREAGPMFSIKVHYISSSQCEVEVYIDYLEEEFGNIKSCPSIDIDPIFEGRVFSRSYHDEGILRGGTSNNSSIYFYSQDKTIAEALRSVVGKIQKHYL